ncbi:hypothetical protein GPJ78_22215, partial [Aeromonas hydrophila]|uniref:hypothetical protein n=1 Tax=Aeromonas hydrophila TaxID=644 RepID=UPI001C5ABEB5
MSSANRRTLAAPCGLPVQRLASPADTRDLLPGWPPASGVSSANRRTLAAPCGLPVQRLASPAGTRDLIAQV